MVPVGRVLVARSPIARLSRRLLLSCWIAAAMASGSAAVAQLETAPALAGLDPVALVEGKTREGKTIEGTAALAVDYQGYRYHFSSKKNRAKFEKDPERYRIQNRYCPVEPSALARPDLFAVHDHKIYIFATPECVEEFEAEPSKYLRSAAPD
jgi:YHS domain-containing protein